MVEACIVLANDNKMSLEFYSVSWWHVINIYFFFCSAKIGILLIWNSISGTRVTYIEVSM